MRFWLCLGVTVTLVGCGISAHKVRRKLLDSLWTDPKYVGVSNMSCPEFTVSATLEQYNRLLDNAESNGVSINGTSATGHDCVFVWNYNPMSAQLHITCIKHPWYASCAEVESKIRELVAKAEGGI